MTFYDPRSYVSREQRLASGDIPFLLPGPVGYVSISPSDLTLHRQGLGSVSSALVTRVRSATEVVSQQNEILLITDEQKGTERLAIDTGEGLNTGDRQLLVLAPEEPAPMTPLEAAVEDEAVAQDVVYDDRDFSDDPEKFDLVGYLIGHVTEQQRISEARNAPPIETANPGPAGSTTAPSTYVAPSGSTITDSTSYNQTVNEGSSTVFVSNTTGGYTYEEILLVTAGFLTLEELDAQKAREGLLYV